MIVSKLRFFPISFVLFPTDFHVSNQHRFQYNVLRITGAMVPKNYFKENITVFRYPEMTILLVLKHARTFFISIINIKRLHFMKRFRLFDSVKNYYFEITFIIQNTKLKFYFGFDIDDSQ